MCIPIIDRFDQIQPSKLLLYPLLLHDDRWLRRWWHRRVELNLLILHCIQVSRISLKKKEKTTKQQTTKSTSSRIQVSINFALPCCTTGRHNSKLSYYCVFFNKFRQTCTHRELLVSTLFNLPSCSNKALKYCCKGAPGAPACCNR